MIANTRRSPGPLARNNIPKPPRTQPKPKDKPPGWRFVEDPALLEEINKKVPEKGALCAQDLEFGFHQDALLERDRPQFYPPCDRSKCPYIHQGQADYCREVREPDDPECEIKRWMYLPAGPDYLNKAKTDDKIGDIRRKIRDNEKRKEAEEKAWKMGLKKAQKLEKTPEEKEQARQRAGKQGREAAKKRKELMRKRNLPKGGGRNNAQLSDPKSSPSDDDEQSVEAV
jgi:hypothetical protein